MLVETGQSLKVVSSSKARKHPNQIFYPPNVVFIDPKADLALLTSVLSVQSLPMTELQALFTQDLKLCHITLLFNKKHKGTKEEVQKYTQQKADLKKNQCLIEQ